jgi:hypothetical protein
MIASGSSPPRCTSTCPTTLQEAKPKAGSTGGRVITRRTADGSEAQKSTPHEFADRLFFSVTRGLTSVLKWAADQPDENESGADAQARTTGGPGQAEMSLTDLAAVLDFGEHSRAAPRGHPNAGSNLRRAEPHERRRTSRARDD